MTERDRVVYIKYNSENGQSPRYGFLFHSVHDRLFPLDFANKPTARLTIGVVKYTVEHSVRDYIHSTGVAICNIAGKI
jgi:hypothetical protein